MAGKVINSTGEKGTQGKRENEISKLRELAKQGLTMYEMGQQMGCSKATINKLINIAKLQGNWFSKEDISSFKRKRKRRENRVETARQKAEQERIEQAQNKTEGASQDEKAERKKEKQNASNNFFNILDVNGVDIKEYRKLRRKAKFEDGLEYDEGEENVSINGRKGLAEFLLKHVFPIAPIVPIPEMDVNIIVNTIYAYRDKFTRDGYLKMLIVNAERTGGLKGVEQMIKRLMEALIDTKFIEPLRGYNKWIKDRITIEEIEKLKSQGLSIDEIAEILKLTTAEVLVLPDRKGKKVDFFGEDVNR